MNKVKTESRFRLLVAVWLVAMVTLTTAVSAQITPFADNPIGVPSSAPGIVPGPSTPGIEILDPSRPATPPVTPSVKPTSATRPSTLGLPEKPAAFAFACKSFTPAQVQRWAGRLGRNFLLGLDPTYAGSRATYDAARKAGLRLHAYLAGPSGQTAGRWDAVEWNRLVKDAAQLGYDVKTKAGMAAWNKEGWRKLMAVHLERARQAGFESAELDNLDRAFGEDERALLGYFAEYAQQVRVGRFPRLMLKNIDADKMQAIAEAIAAGRLPRLMFADFHIWEADFGRNPAGSQAIISRSLGILTVESPDTENYSASNLPDLLQEILDDRHTADSETPSLW